MVERAEVRLGGCEHHAVHDLGGERRGGVPVVGDLGLQDLGEAMAGKKFREKIRAGDPT